MSEVVATPEKKEKKKPVYAVYPAAPTSINEIDLKYVAAYLKGERDNGNLSADDFATWGKKYAATKKEKDTRFFMTFRKEFTKTFFKNLYSTKGKAAKKPNALDELFAEFL